MSLTRCLKEAGDLLPAADKVRILERVAELRRTGTDSEEAARMAVREVLAEARQARIDAGDTMAEEKPRATAKRPSVEEQPTAGAAPQAVTQAAPATHADPGKPAEPATQAVVAETIAKAADRTDRTRSQMKADLLRMIDEALPHGSAQGGSSSTEAAIRNMIDDDDPQAAVDFAAAMGVDLGALLKGDKVRAPKVAWLKPSEEAVAEFAPEASPTVPAPAQESPESIARRTEIRDRARAYWDGTATPAIREYLRAFDAFGADRMERNQIKPKGMSAREWLESFVSRQSKWDGSRKVQGTGIEALSAKDLWPTDDGLGERLRKSMLAAVRALKNAPMTSGEMLADAFMEKRAATPETPPPVSSAAGQKNLAYRGSRIASLLAMNEQIRKLDPTEAWHPDNINDATDLDALQDSISSTLVRLQREREAATSQPTPPAPAAEGEAQPTKIDDVGEKIGGARKDQWKERGLAVADLDAMSESEGATLVNKANVWKPDYAEIAEAADPVTAAMVKVVYDSLAAKPKKDTPQGRRDYVRGMQAVRKVYGAVQSADEAKEAYRALRIEIGVERRTTGSSGFERTRDADAERALFALYKGRSDPFVFGYNELARARALLKDGFPGAVEPWTRRYVLRDYGGASVTDAGVSIYEERAAEMGTPLTRDQIRAGFTEVRTKAGKVVAYAPTRQDAMVAAKALYERTKGSTDGKEEPDRPHLDKVTRENLPQRIDREVSAETLRESFGFRGIEFGNWAAQDERRKVLALAYDALADLASILNLPHRALSLNGTMGLAFGARGGGRFAAHYEPGKLVVNMTKLRGAGSLAHEWAHALDHYLGELDRVDAYQSKARGASGWYSQESYNDQPRKRMVQRDGQWVPVEEMRLPNLRPELAAEVDALMKRLYETPIPREEALDIARKTVAQYTEMAAKMDDSRLKATYTEGADRAKRLVAALEAGEPSDKTRRSSFAQEAQKLSGKSADGYWVRPTEMLARAFESYVFDRLMAMGARSDYLVHGVEQDRYSDGTRYKGNPYPTGEERQAINKAFDDLFSTIKTRDTDKGVALFSRASLDRGMPAVAVDREGEYATYFNADAGLTIAFPQRTERVEVIEADGEQVVNYAVMPADGFEPYGYVELLVKDGTPTSLLDIYINPEARKLGVARGVLETILAAHPDADLNISNIVEDARGFWERMGIPAQNLEAGAAYDGTLNWQAFTQATNPRGAQGDGRAGGQARQGGARQGAGARQPAAQQEGVALAELQDLVDRFGSSVVRVNVVQSVDDMPPAKRATVLRSAPDGRVRGAYFHSSDEIYVVAQHLRSMEEATFVVLHEAFHRGLAKTIGPEAKALLRRMYHTNGNLRKLTDLQVKKHKIDLDEAIEEALADMAGEGKARDLRGWQKLLTLVRGWLGKIASAVGIEMTWTDDMVEDFVAGIRRDGLRADVQVDRMGEATMSRAEPNSGQTDTEAFRAWFGDSKVVDAQGRPLVVYHGTNKEITAFKPGRGGGAIWFATDPKLANLFVGGGRRSMGDGAKKGSAVYPVHLSIQNPVNLGNTSPQDALSVADVLRMAGLPADDAALGKIARANLSSGYAFVSPGAGDPVQYLVNSYGGRRGARASNTLDDPGLMQTLQEAGFDGLQMKEEGAVTYAAFRPEQIKSATGNRGTFDPNEADIRLSRALTRRDLLLGAAAAAVTGGTQGKTTLGKAQPIPEAVMRAALPADVQKILIGSGVGTTNLQGAKATKDALLRIAETGPQELRALARQTAALLPDGRLMLTVVGGQWNAHGAVSWGGPEGPHLRLMNGQGMEGLTYGTFIHEAMHAAVLARYINLNTGVVRDNDTKLGGTPKAVGAIEQFRKVWDEFRIATRGARESDANLQMALDEARGDPDEFFVRAMTDPLLQRYMAGREYEGKTLWDRFKDWIKSTLFGFSKDGVTPSWLDAATTAAQDLLQAMPADAADYSRLGKYLTLKGEGAKRDAKLSRAPTIDAIRDAKLPAGYIVADLLKSSGKLGWWHKTVGTMHNLAEREPLFKRMYDATQRFLSDVSLYATEAANLAPTLLPKLERFSDVFKSPADAKDVQAVAAPIFEGTLKWTRDEDGQPVETVDVDTAGIRWTDAELRERFKLSDLQVRMYREFRRATDRSLSDLAASHMVQLGGADVAPVRAAAMAAPSPRAAAQILAQHLEDMAEGNEDRAEILVDTAARITAAGDRAQSLIDRGYAPLMRFGRYTLDAVDERGERIYFGLFDTEREANRFARNLQQQYPRARIAQGTMSEQDYKMFAGVSPETVELFGTMLGLDGTGDAASDKAFQEYLKNAKSNRSALRRLIHRQGVAGFNEDAGRVLASFVYSNARQTAKNLHLGEMGDALMSIKEEKGRGELLDSAIELHQYVSNPTEEAQRIKGLLFAQFLGGSIAAGLVNMTQPFMVTFPYLSQFGGAGRAAMQMRRATADALKQSTGDAALDKAMQRAAEEGIVAPQEVHSLMAQARGAGTLKSGGDVADKASNFTSKLAWVWGRPFAMAEQLNRRITFIASYRTAVEQGMEDPAGFAARAVEETQFTYNKANRPQWARGAVGGLLFTFKQYSISYVELLSRMAASGPEGKRAAAIALGMLMLTAGMQGLPGADDLDDVIDGLMQRLGYNWSTKQKKREALASLVGDDWAQFLLRGVSGLPGAPIDVANRLGLGNLIPGTGLLPKKADYGRDVAEIAGPVGSFGKQVATAVGAATEGNLRGAAEAVMPVAAANLLKAYDMASTGMYRDARGRKVLDVTAADAVAKAIGFQPGDVAKVQNAAQEVQRTIDLVKTRETEIADRWARGIFEGDSAAVTDARAELARWNADNPEARIAISSAQVLKRVKAMAMSREDRIRKTTPKEIRSEVGRQLDAAR